MRRVRAMASSSGVQQQQQQQQQHFDPHSSNSFHCKECGLILNSAESLDVHRQYHKENLLTKWAAQAAAAAASAVNNTSHNTDETNNNNTKPNMKREFIPNSTVAAAADSSDAMLNNNKKSPDYGNGSRTTPETAVNFGHPPTPQSYQSASSPYHDNSAFSPGYQNYQAIKQERATTPNSHYYNFTENHQFFNLETQQQQPTYDYLHKIPSNASSSSSYRYHPYQQQASYERNNQVSSSSPAYPPQPTPSPSPKQCDKCGYVCETATQLVEHLNIAHPPTTYQPPNQHFLFGNHHPQQAEKTDEEQQSEILDLDSHKVHQIYAEDEKRHNGDAMLTPWPQQKIFDQRVFVNGKMFVNGDGVFPPQEQKIFQDYGGVTTTSTQEAVVQNYRAFDHVPPAQPATPVITSTQVTNPPVAAAANAPPSNTRSANWKSNEARRPKTYNCTACNKWFTSSGHLKRHYNTTLHKNAVKSSGRPDPATLPISAHHHPARDSSSRDDHSPNDDSRGDENSMPSSHTTPPILQQQAYDRQPPPNLQHPMGAGSLTNLTNGSPPNGEAGPSAINNSRDLLTINTPTSHHHHHHGFNMAAPPASMVSSMENLNQFPMYPNVSAPHVTQPTATTTSSHNTSGEEDFNHQYVSITQPLPSFAQIQAHRYGCYVDDGNNTANVGGGGLVTAPYSTLYETASSNESAVAVAVASPTTTLIFRQDDEEFKLVLNVDDPPQQQEVIEQEVLISYSPPISNNNNNDDDLYTDKSGGDEKPKAKKSKAKRDYEETSPQITSSTTVAQTGVHKCFDCDKTFNKACYLTQHNKTFHSGDKPYKCQRCGKRYSNETIYENHVKRHGGNKPYKCKDCVKQFNHKTDLRRHMCSHTGFRPYKCGTCEKGFIRKDHMLKHCETHTRRPHVAARVAAVR